MHLKRPLSSLAMGFVFQPGLALYTNHPSVRDGASSAINETSRQQPGELTEQSPRNAQACTSWQTVYPGDTCATLPKRCGVSADLFNRHHSADFCENLWPGQPFCCTVGTFSWETSCWRSKDCLNPLATNTEQDSKKRWNGLCGEDAWGDAIDRYRSIRGKKTTKTFSSSLSDYFHGRSGMHCGVVAGENGCRTNNMCLQGIDTGPAGELILNSFVSISDFFLNFYEGVVEASQRMQSSGANEQFINAFAPTPNQDMTLKIIMDVVIFAVNALLAPIINQWLNKLPWAAGNPIAWDNTKDVGKLLIIFGFGTGREFIANIPPPESKGTAVSNQLDYIVESFKGVISSTSLNLFNGSDISVWNLHRMIKDGKLLEAESIGKLDLEDRMSKLLYAMLIPELWRMSEQKPILISTNYHCHDKPMPGDNVRPIDDTVHICAGDKKYYFGKTSSKRTDCGHSYPSQEHRGPSPNPKLGRDLQVRDNECLEIDVEALPGFDMLDGKHFGGLTKDDLIKSIMNRMDAGMGNPKGPATLPDFTQDSNFNHMWDWATKDDMVQTPGIIDIPMCDVGSLQETWAHEKDDFYSYPCPRP